MFHYFNFLGNFEYDLYGENFIYLLFVYFKIQRIQSLIILYYSIL